MPNVHVIHGRAVGAAPPPSSIKVGLVDQKKESTGSLFLSFLTTPKIWPEEFMNAI